MWIIYQITNYKVRHIGYHDTVVNWLSVLPCVYWHLLWQLSISDLLTYLYTLLAFSSSGFGSTGFGVAFFIVKIHQDKLHVLRPFLWCYLTDKHYICSILSRSHLFPSTKRAILLLKSRSRDMSNSKVPLKLQINYRISWKMYAHRHQIYIYNTV